MPALSSDTLHASCVAIDGRGVLLGGRSGVGKSDLALRLIDRGAVLVADDYTIVRRSGDRLTAAVAQNIAGHIEIRGIGIVKLPYVEGVEVALYVDLDAQPIRLPQRETRLIAGHSVPMVALAALEASAPLKVERALALFGTPA